MTTSFPFKLRGSQTERVTVARLEDEYIFKLNPDPDKTVIQISAESLREKVGKTQAKYDACGFWKRLGMSLAEKWYSEKIDTNVGYIKVGCPSKKTVQINLPITLPTTEYPYDPIRAPKPYSVSQQANILISLSSFKEALEWCDEHANEHILKNVKVS